MTVRTQDMSEGLRVEITVESKTKVSEITKFKLMLWLQNWTPFFPFNLQDRTVDIFVRFHSEV